MLGPLESTKYSYGTYSYGRKAAFVTYALTQAIKEVKDPGLLVHLRKISDKLASNLKDHDGRGYAYFQYGAPPANKNIRGSGRKWNDINYLDDSLLAGHVAQLALTFDAQRAIYKADGDRADFWANYLHKNWVPKWRQRSSLPNNKWIASRDSKYPTADLSNAGISTFSSFHPSKWNGAGEHIYPLKEFGHPYMAQLGVYYTLSVMTNDTDYDKEVKTRSAWWHDKITYNKKTDGLIWWLYMSKSKARLKTRGYSQHVTNWVINMHDLGVYKFASTSNMKNYANQMAAVYPLKSNGQPNLSVMRKFQNATGNEKSTMILHGLWSGWDNSGVLHKHNKAVISNPKVKGRHWMDSNSKAFQHPGHLASLLRHP